MKCGLSGENTVLFLLARFETTVTGDVHGDVTDFSMMEDNVRQL